MANLVGFALALTTRYKKESMVESSFSSAKQTFTQKFESPSFQVEYQKNWKVNDSSHGIQKSKC